MSGKRVRRRIKEGKKLSDTSKYSMLKARMNPEKNT